MPEDPATVIVLQVVQAQFSQSLYNVLKNSQTYRSISVYFAFQ